MRDVHLMKFLQLTTSYVDPTLPWSMQREALNKQYRFDIGDSTQEAVDSEYTQDLLKTVDEAEKMYIERGCRSLECLVCDAQIPS